MGHWKRWHFMLVVVGLWAFTYLLGLGWGEIKSEEAKRIMPAQTMLASDNWQAWVLPSVGGEPYYKKPPGINWLIAASFALTGSQNEWAARLPSALLVGLLAAVMAGLPCAFLSATAQFLAALILLASVGMLEKGRLIEIDGPLTALTGLALVWWLYRYADRPRGWSTWIGAALFLAAGTLLKGPFLAAAACPVIFLVLVFRHRLRDLFCPASLVSLALILAVGLGWAVLAGRQANTGNMTEIWSSQLATRFLPSRILWGLWVQEVGGALVLMMPFILLAPLLWMNRFTGHLKPVQLPYIRALRWGSAVGFVLLGMIPGAMARYALPVLPGIALALGAVLEGHRQAVPSDRWWRVALVAGFVIASAMAVFCLVALGFVYPAGMVVGLLAIAALVVVVVRPSVLADGPRLTVATGLLMCLLATELMAYSWPFRQQGEMRRPAGAAITRLVGKDQALDVYRPGYAPFLYYVRCPMRIIASGDSVDPPAQSVLLAGRDPRQPELMARLLGQNYHVTYEISLQEGTWQLLQYQDGGPLILENHR